MSPAVLDPAAFLRILEREGWRVRACRRSHHELVHPAGGVLDVAFHKRLGQASVQRGLARAKAAASRLPRTGMP